MNTLRPSRLWRGVLFCFSIVAIVGFAPLAAQIDSAKSQAEEAYTSGRVEESADLFRKALEEDPGWSAGWKQLGQIYFDSGAFLEARNALRRTLSIDQNDASAWAWLGLSEFQIREYDRSIQSLFRARSLEINDEALNQQVKLHQAMLLSRMGQFDASFLILFDLAYHRPGDPVVRDALGIAALRMPFLPEEVPADRKEAVALAGQVMGSLADFRLEHARELYSQLAAQASDRLDVESANPDLLLKVEGTDGFPINSATEIRASSEVEIPEQDLVLGVVLEGEARAYPVNYMNGPMNEVVNDVLGATPILSTW